MAFNDTAASSPMKSPMAAPIPSSPTAPAPPKKQEYPILNVPASSVPELQNKQVGDQCELTVQAMVTGVGDPYQLQIVDVGTKEVNEGSVKDLSDDELDNKIQQNYKELP